MTIGNWLRTEACAHDLNLAALLNQSTAAGDPLLSRYGQFVEAARQAVAPFQFGISPTAEGVRVEGDPVAVMIASRILEQLLAASMHDGLDARTVAATVSDAVTQTLQRELALALNGLPKFLAVKSVPQAAYLKTLLASEDQLVLGLGPTGTGKTHIAIAAAFNQLAEDRIHRIVLTRPHVVMEGEIVTAATRQELEADGQLDYFDDILFELLGYDKVAELKRNRKLEVIPLGRMRGRTFDNAFIIMDEAQNATIAKMRMVVTRIGAGTRMVLTGDPSHVELLEDERSGLLDLIDMIEGTDLGKIHRFENRDIVRNGIVARLNALYASRRNEQEREIGEERPVQIGTARFASGAR